MKWTLISLSPFYLMTIEAASIEHTRHSSGRGWVGDVHDRKAVFGEVEAHILASIPVGC